MSGSWVQVPGVRSAGSRCPGVRFQVPGSSICKNKLWIDFYTSSDIFRGFSGHIVSCKTIPPNIYWLKVSNRNNKNRREICSWLTIKIPIGVEDVVLVSLLLTLNIFHTVFLCFYCLLGTGKCWLGVVLERL